MNEGICNRTSNHDYNVSVIDFDYTKIFNRIRVQITIIPMSGMKLFVCVLYYIGCDVVVTCYHDITIYLKVENSFIVQTDEITINIGFRNLVVEQGNEKCVPYLIILSIY